MVVITRRFVRHTQALGCTLSIYAALNIAFSRPTTPPIPTPPPHKGPQPHLPCLVLWAGCPAHSAGV